jgi:hypothetical protein
VVEAPAAVLFAGAICAPAATVGGDGGSEVKWWRNGDGEDGGGFPSLAALLSDRDGEYRWGMTAQVNLVSRACRPPPLFIAQYDGGPPTM